MKRHIPAYLRTVVLSVFVAVAIDAVIHTDEVSKGFAEGRHWRHAPAAVATSWLQMSMQLARVTGRCYAVLFEH